MATLSPDDPYHNPERTGDSFEERIGDPDAFSASIGHVVVSYSWLESALSDGIANCLNLNHELGKIVTSEISFGTKVHMLSSLVRHLASKRNFNVGTDDPLVCWGKISAQCFRAEELRNQVMHSQWSPPVHSKMSGVRKKITAKASRGLAEHAETINSSGLLDIADYMNRVTMFVEEFFLEVDT
jgi:hypothetical protein